MTDTYVIERPDGSQEIFNRRPCRGPDGEIVRWSRADRPADIDGIEDWDFSARRWVVNPDRAQAWIDRKHLNDQGQRAIDLARAVKLVEARQILGLPTTVALEAEQLGIPVEELAQQIVAKSEPGTDAELERIKGKAAARAVPLRKK